MNIYKSTLIILFLAFASAVCAQPQRDKQETRDRIEAMRISFITQRLDLSTEEAQKFWPVYNEYRKELEQVLGNKEEGPHHHGPKPDIDKMSDSEVKTMMEEEMEKHAKLLTLRKNYFQKFQKVLPIKKVAKLYDAERDFQRQLIRKLSDKRKENH